MKKEEKGFTLLEILLVVAAIAILAGIVILAINPNKQLGDTRNAQRKVDINTILNAVYQYSVDNNGTLPAGIATTTSTEICITSATSGQCAASGKLYLGDLTLAEKYLVSMPLEPVASNRGTDGIGYRIQQTVNGRVSILAPFGENGVGTTTVTR
jgi:prepilin-type N-terminal cleavage/methylation domain-containing protein